LPLTASIEQAISLFSFTRLRRGGCLGLHCAHRATTASSWGSASRETMPAVSPLPFQTPSSPLQGWRLIDLPPCAPNRCLFIWSISSIWFVWLIGLEIHPEELDRPERPANQTDEPERVARARTIISIPPTVAIYLNLLSWGCGALPLLARTGYADCIYSFDSFGDIQDSSCSATALYWLTICIAQ